MVPQAGGGGVGAQREGLFQAAGVCAPRQGQRPAAGQAGTSCTAGRLLLVQIGGQALGVARPAAGQARVEPGPVGLARKRGGLVVTDGKAVGVGVGEVAQTRRGEVEVVAVSQIPDHPKRRVVCKGGVFPVDAVVCRDGGGAWAADNAGLLAHGAHGLVMLFRQVVVTVQVPAAGHLSQNPGTPPPSTDPEHQWLPVGTNKAPLQPGTQLGSPWQRNLYRSLPPGGALRNTKGHLRPAGLRYPHLSGAEGVETEVVIIMDDL